MGKVVGTQPVRVLTDEEQADAEMQEHIGSSVKRGLRPEGYRGVCLIKDGEVLRDISWELYDELLQRLQIRLDGHNNDIAADPPVNELDLIAMKNDNIRWCVENVFADFLPQEIKDKYNQLTDSNI